MGHIPTGGITSATIGNEVEILPDHFLNGSKITEITIPESVTSIGGYAFFGCFGLTSVTNNSLTPQSIDDYVFYGVDVPNCKLYVWHESLDAYKAAIVWKDFDIQDMGGVEGVEVDAATKEVEGFYDLKGIRLNEPARGQAVIVRYTDGTAKKVVVK